METEKMQKPKVRLAQGVMYKLMQLVEAEFRSKKLSRAEFAVYAQEKLNCPQITLNHIIGCCSALGLVNQRATVTKITMESLISLEKRITAIEAKLRNE